MNEAAVLAIINYMEECLFEPKRNWPEYWFNQKSYSRWAANEILERVMDHPMMPPIMVIEEFMITMDLYSCMAEDTRVSIIFSIAKDTAEDIMSLFL